MSARRPFSSTSETASTRVDPSTSRRYGTVCSITSGSALSQPRMVRGTISAAPHTNAAVTTLTHSEPPSAARAAAGSLAPIARAIKATQAKPTANNADCVMKKNCVA